MNERLDIKKELKRKFAKITLDYCGHLLENHINKTDEQLQRRFYLFSGNWGIASIYPFPTGLIWF